MARPKITEPVTNNKERALEQNRHTPRPAEKGRGGPSRAHSRDSSGGGKEKKEGSSAPKVGGRPRG